MADEQERDDVFDDAADDSGQAGSSDESPAPPAPPADASSDSDRVNDLMSKWQTEQARANRAETELKALKAGTTGGDSSKPAPAETGTGSTEFVEFAREHSRQLLYESEPRLAAYGLGKEAIEGSSVEAMQASLARQRATLDAMESRIRNDVLSEHGIDPGLAGGSGEKPRDFATMPAEEFEKYVARAKSGL